MKTARIRVGLEWIALASAALILLISVAYGFQYIVADAAKVRYFRLFTLPFAAIVLVLSWFVISPCSWRVSEPRVWFRLGFALMSASFLLSCYLYSNFLIPYPWWLPGVGVPVVAYLLHDKFWAWGSNLVFLLGLLLVTGYLIVQLPNNAGGDMLEIIEFSARDFLAGSSPFRPYLTVSGREVPFGYWPGIWLPYVPFVALGLDLRLLNLLALVGLVLLFETAARNSGYAPLIASLTLYPFLLSPSVMGMIVLGHLWVYWLAACAAVLLIARERHLAAAAVLGFCLASRPTALFMAVPLAVYIWSRYGMRRALSLSAVTLAVTMAFNLPFAIVYGKEFWDNSYGVLGGVNQDLVHFSLAAYFKDAGLDFVNKPLQVVVLIVSMAIVILRKNMPVQHVIMLAGLTYVWMILFNSYATRYVYFTGFLLFDLGLVLLLANSHMGLNNTRISQAPLHQTDAGDLISSRSRQDGP